MRDGERKQNAYLNFSQASYVGFADYYARFIENKQLSDTKLWKKFVKVFIDRSDIVDEGWRSEYWGKMMRGACMTYAYTRNAALYGVLEDAVKGLLETQDDFGRISGYDVAHEFTGWDVWGRKYVLVGLEYFYEICRDEKLKERILQAMCRHLDYIVEKVGNGKGQIAITDTSEWWGSVNACSILEPVIQLYKLTEKEKYKTFAEYILSTGGCSKGNLIELVQSGKNPFEFPVTKAYEMMSFFEGLVAYYEVSGKKEYLKTAEKFAESIYNTDITVIGCAGCTHELFDNAAEKQTEYSDTIMQETCVTVTWMRLNARLWENTQSAKYMDRIEQSALNVLFGSINTCELPMYSFEKNALTPPLPFDSYSPLYNNVRGRGVGGFKEFPEGGNYGCCACIGAAGTALYPLYAVVKRNNKFYVNFYMQGESADATPSGQEMKLVCATKYPADGEIELEVKLAKAERFEICVRIPSRCAQATVTCVDTHSVKNGYFTIDKVWQDGDKIFIRLPEELNEVHKNGKTAFTYGSLVLARDEGKEDGNITIAFSPSRERGKLQYTIQSAEEGEQLRILLMCDDNTTVLLTDYASCGKNWVAERNRISVWVNEA